MRQGIPFLKRFTVFNAEQCDGLPEDIAAMAAPPGRLILPQAEALIRATGADLRIGGDRAYYDVAHDHVRVPPPQAYAEPINWHRTALHELGHWSGAAGRLGRDLSGSFGSKKYAQEELVAEMASAFLCASGRRADRAPCRLHRRLAPGAPRRRPGDRSRRERGVQGRRLPPRLFAAGNQLRRREQLEEAA